MKRTNLLIRILFCIAFFGFILRGGISAQVNIQVIVNPPFVQQAEAYLEPFKAKIILTNTTANELRVKIGGNVKNTLNQGGQTKPNFTTTRPIILNGGETKVLSAADLQGVYRFSNFDIFGLSEAEKQQLVRDRLIPEGFYTVCMRVFDFANNNPLSQEACYDFNVEGVDPPQIIGINTMQGQYNCGATVEQGMVFVMSFMWSPPVTFGVAANVNYTFEMYQVPQGIDPQQFVATGNARPLFSRENIPAPFLQLPPGEVQLNLGFQYAFRVRAVDPLNQTGFRNNGWSAVCSFVYGQIGANGDGSSLNALAHFPNAPALWIPFEKMPLTMRINSSVPLSQYKYFESRLKISKVDENCTNAEFQGMPNFKVWQGGGLAGRREETGDATLSENMARLIPANQPFENLNLLRGAEYFWCADVKMGYATDGRDTRNVTANGRFKHGIGISKPSRPAKGDNVAKGSIKLQWKTADAPTNLFPDNYKIVQAQAGAVFGNDFTNGRVFEKWVLDVSDKADFADFYVQKTGEIRNEGYGTATKSSIIAALYKNLEETIPIDRDGKFYWRLRWLTDPSSADLNSGSYAQSEVFNFTVGGGGQQGGGQQANPQDEPTVACTEGCKSTNADMLAVNLDPSVFKLNTDLNEKIQIGQFELMVTKVTNLIGNTMSGQGRITIVGLFGQPAFPLLVDFSNIQINQNRIVVSGYARGQNLPSEQLSPYIKNNGMLDGLPMFTTGDNVGDFFTAAGDQLFSNAASNVRQSGFKLPIGHRLGGASNVLFAINRFRFFPKAAYFGAVVEVNLPDANPKVIALGVDDACVGKDGLCGTLRAFLNKDLEVDIAGDKLTFLQYNGGGGNPTGTFAQFTEGSFEKLRVEGFYQFSPNLFVGEDKVSPVKATLAFETKSFSDFIAEFQMGNFYVKGNDEWQFQQDQKGYWDHDANRNPDNLPIIEGKSQLQNDVTWFGFIVPEMQLQLPKIIKNGDNNSYPMVKITNFIIDAKGLTGEVEVPNILPLEKGVISGWGASVDKFSFKMFESKFQSAGLSGRIVLPISNLAKSGANAQLDYFCNLTNYGDQNQQQQGTAFEFQVKPKDKFAFDVIVGVGTIHQSSNIKMKKSGDEFVADALLNGQIDIGHDFGGVVGKVDFAQIKFQNLGISKSNVSTGTWSLSSPQKKMAGFPLSLKNVKPYTNASGGGFDLGISFDIQLAITDDPEKQVLRALTNLSLYGEIRPLNNGRLQPRLEGIGAKLNAVEVQGDLKAVKFYGRIDIYRDHQTFGNGFKGAVVATFPSMDFGAAATFQIGKVNNYNYWYVDLMVDFGTVGVAIVPPLQLYGVGGGAYYHMRQGDTRSLVLSDNRDTSGAGAAKFKQVGMTPSGVTYVPDANIGLGVKLKAVAGIRTGGGTAILDAGVQLEMAFNQNWGISLFRLDGDAAYFKAGAASNGLATGKISVVYKVDENILDLHAEGNMRQGVQGVFEVVATVPLHVYIDASGKPKDGKGTEGVKWFLKMGTPAETAGKEEVSGGVKAGPISLKTKLLGQDLVTFEAYFQVGSFGLDPMPPIPDWIKQVFVQSGINASFFENDMKGEGDGIRFGAKWGYNFNQTVTIFRGRLRMVLGFDLSLEHYDTDCDGNKTGNQIGMNGWYAQGQMYAGINATLSIHVDMFFIDDDFVIFDAAAAAVLRAGLPNPIWLKGAIGGRYSILDGLVSGAFHFNFSIGKECSPQSDPLEKIELIASTFPNDGEKTRILADMVPTATFNAKIDKEFSFTIVDKEGKESVRKFRSRSDLVRAQLIDQATNSSIALKSGVNPDGYTMYFVPQSGLSAAAAARYKFIVSAQMEELMGASYDANSKTLNGGEWRIARRKDGTEFNEIREIANISLKPLDSIPRTSIAYTYPFYYQRFFLPDECTNLEVTQPGQRTANLGGSGRIALRQTYSMSQFSNKENFFSHAEVRVIRLMPIEGEQNPVITRINLVNNNLPEKISFSLPPMLAEGTYLAQLILVPRPPDVKSGEKQFVLSTRSLGFRIKNNYQGTDSTNVNLLQAKVAERMSLGYGEKRITTIYFKVSSHRNFDDKAKLFDLERVDFQVEGRFTEVIDYYNPKTGRFTRTYRPVRKEAKVPLSKSEVERTKTEGIQKVLKERIIANNLLPQFGMGSELYVLGMNHISFAGGECFDDYDLLGYQKQSSIQGNEGYTSSMPALVQLSNKSVSSWIDKVMSNLNSISGLTFSQTGTMELPPENGYALQVRAELSSIGARLLSKLSPNEAIGAAAFYDCGDGSFYEFPEYKGLPMADQNNSDKNLYKNFYSFGPDAMTTIRLQYSLRRMIVPYSANNLVMGMNFAGANLFADPNLFVLGQSYNIVANGANAASLQNGTFGMGYSVPGGCPSKDIIFTFGN